MVTDRNKDSDKTPVKQGSVPAADESAAPDRAARAGLCAGDAASPALKAFPAGPSSAVHRNLCTARKRNEARIFGAGSGGNGLSGGRCRNENRTDLLNNELHQPSATSARGADRAHNSGVI